MNKHIWANFKENASRGGKIYKKHLNRVPQALWEIGIVIAMSFTYLIAPFAWFYFAIFRDEEKYAELVKRYDAENKD